MSKKNSTIKIDVKGVIQGVGFRPFIYNLAKFHNINGYVLNKGNIVEIVANGEDNKLKEFINDIKIKKPKLSVIEDLSISFLNNYNKYITFEI